VTGATVDVDYSLDCALKLSEPVVGHLPVRRGCSRKKGLSSISSPILSLLFGLLMEQCTQTLRILLGNSNAMRQVPTRISS
jgi:hypothetical protein